MKAQRTIVVRAVADTSVNEVWRLLADVSTWTVWGPFDEAVLERPGFDTRDGAGAIRRFRAGRWTSRELVVESVPEERLVYELLSGLPLRDYRATATLSTERGRTHIQWVSTFRPSIPFTSRLTARTLTKRIQRVADALAIGATRAEEAVA